MMWLVTFLLLAVVFVAFALHFRRLPRNASLAHLDVLCDTQVDRYVHIRRLLAPEDFHYLASNRRGSALLPILRRQRVRVLSLYLSQMRDEFHSLVAIAALFAAAPTARNERFAQRIALMRLRFAALSLRVRLVIWLNALLPLPMDIAPVAQHIRTLRSQADDILHRLTPQDLAMLRSVLRAG